VEANQPVKTSRILLLLVFGFLAQPLCRAGPPMGKVVWWGAGGMDFDRQTPSYEHTNGVIESRHEILTNVVALCPNGEMVLNSDGTPFQLGYMMDLPPPGMKSMFVFSTDVPAGLSNVVSIAMEGESYWAIKQDGTVTRWGNDQDDANVVAELRDIKSIAWAGIPNFLALRNDGTLLGFRLGAATTNAAATGPAVRPVTVDGQVLSNVVAMASLGISPLVLKRDGSLFALGCQTPGVLPRQPQYHIVGNTYNFDPGGEYSQVPYRFTSADPVMAGGKALTHVAAIASSISHSLALMDDGTVVSFGENVPNVARVPAGLSNVVAIAVDESFSLALKRDGMVAAWGDNSSNQTAVPAGLSNVVAIAAGRGFSGVAMALTTGNVPSSVHIQPHGCLEEMAEVSDLVFKARVLSTGPKTKAGIEFGGMPVNETKLQVISVLKGNPTTNIVAFQHFTAPYRGGWSGPGGPPPYYQLQVGQCCLIFAGSMDKPGAFDDPAPNVNVKHPPDEFREIDGQGFSDAAVTPTLDARPLDGLTIKDAYWLELNLLLNNANTNNVFYAIDKLDYMSLAGGSDDEWRHSDVFKRPDVLSALLPLVTNTNEKVASRSLQCFAADSHPASQLRLFADALVRVANNSPSALTRVEAINVLSGMDGEAVSNSLASLLKCPDENVRVSAVGLLPRLPREFAEQALRERADDESASVRLEVAEAIGTGKFAGVLSTLTKLLADSSGPVFLKRLLPTAPLQIYPQSSVGDVRSSAGRALLKFDVDQVADILKTNLNDPTFHVAFISKLAEQDATPWLPELAGILESRLKYSDELSKSPANDPRRISDPTGSIMLIGAYGICWEDIRHYLLRLPREKLPDSDTARYMDLLESTIQNNGETMQEAWKLYELYRTQGLEQRAAGIRQKYASEAWWFDDFDAHHPELKAAVKP
jgi:hypothetical protein